MRVGCPFLQPIISYLFQMYLEMESRSHVSWHLAHAICRKLAYLVVEPGSRLIQVILALVFSLSILAARAIAVNTPNFWMSSGKAESPPEPMAAGISVTSEEVAFFDDASILKHLSTVRIKKACAPKFRNRPPSPLS